MTSDPSTTALSAGQLAELTAGRLLSSWQLDIPALLLIAVLATLYGWGVRRIHRRGERWSPARTAAFALLGLGALTVATMSGLAVYDRAVLVAAVQNILLDLVAPWASPSATRCASRSRRFPRARRRGSGAR